MTAGAKRLRALCDTHLNLKETRLIEAAIIAASGDQPIRMRRVRFFIRERIGNKSPKVNSASNRNLDSRAKTTSWHVLRLR
jgi:hypothetical protein